MTLLAQLGLVIAQAAPLIGGGVGGGVGAEGGEGAKTAAEGRFALWGDYSLSDPVFLLLIPLGLLLLWRGRSRRGRVDGRVPVVGGRLQRSFVQRAGWIPTVLEIVALTLVAIALARPLRGNVQSTSVSEGVDIALVIDRSSSMQHTDLERGRTRLEVVKEVVQDFAVRRMTDREGAADNIALISFAAYPQLLCPFTLDVDAITGFLSELQHVTHRAEDGTAIGIALAKAVAVLRETEAESKVVVLLTDGENNIDAIAPREAAQLAAEEGIRVHTVFAGRFVYTIDFFGREVRTEREIDTRDLQYIAEQTGGRFFRAKDRDALEAVYAAIEDLERTPREEERWSESFDLYLEFLLAALGVWTVAWVSHVTWARRLP